MDTVKHKWIEKRLVDGKQRVYLFGHCVLSRPLPAAPLAEYTAWLSALKNDKSTFVPFTKTPFVRTNSDPKIFAYYLPQFHAIEENDNAHGKGFTEWTNVASCVPQFVGHEQPKIPYDVGFYNLLMPGVMERQVEIAKAYGLYGFCFYYYWFSGKKVLEKPLEYFLHSSIDFKFHFCWANENWSKLWDGGDREVILKQELKEADAEKFFADILPYIKDERYEKIDNKPLLMIYRPSLFDKTVFCQFIATLQRLAKQEGFNGLYIMAANAFEKISPKDYSCEGVIEFPPHQLPRKEIAVRKINPKLPLAVHDLTEYIAKRKYIYPTSYPVWKACFPSWDNTPRKLYSHAWVWKISPEQYKTWLAGILAWTKQTYPVGKQYVYINAWNEWAEGAILEPTVRRGYQNLEIVKQCLENIRMS